MIILIIVINIKVLIFFKLTATMDVDGGYLKERMEAKQDGVEKADGRELVDGEHGGSRHAWREEAGGGWSGGGGGAGGMEGDGGGMDSDGGSVQGEQHGG